MKIEKPAKVNYCGETNKCKVCRYCNRCDASVMVKIMDEYEAYEKHKEARMPSVNDIAEAMPYRCPIAMNKHMRTNLAKEIHSLYKKWWRDGKGEK